MLKATQKKRASCMCMPQAGSMGRGPSPSKNDPVIRTGMAPTLPMSFSCEDYAEHSERKINKQIEPLSCCISLKPQICELCLCHLPCPLSVLSSASISHCQKVLHFLSQRVLCLVTRGQWIYISSTISQKLLRDFPLMNPHVISSWWKKTVRTQGIFLRWIYFQGCL